MESSNNIAQYLFKNQKETIKASLIEFFKRNNLYATSEKYDHPEENNFSFTWRTGWWWDAAGFSI